MPDIEGLEEQLRLSGLIYLESAQFRVSAVVDEIRDISLQRRAEALENTAGEDWKKRKNGSHQGMLEDLAFLGSHKSNFVENTSLNVVSTLVIISDDDTSPILETEQNTKVKASLAAGPSPRCSMTALAQMLLL